MATTYRRSSLPVQDLLDRVASILGNTTPSSADIAEAVGVSARHVKRWRTGQTLTLKLRTGEDAADRLGLHPMEIWGFVYVDAVLGVDNNTDSIGEADDLEAGTATRLEVTADRKVLA